jgi:hypothetical protein
MLNFSAVGQAAWSIAGSSLWPRPGSCRGRKEEANMKNGIIFLKAVEVGVDRVGIGVSSRPTRDSR